MPDDKFDHSNPNGPTKESGHSRNDKHLLKRDVELVTAASSIGVLILGMISAGFLSYHFTVSGILTGCSAVSLAVVPLYYLISFHRFKRLVWGYGPNCVAYCASAILAIVGGACFYVAQKFVPEKFVPEDNSLLIPAHDPTPKTACTPDDKKGADVTGQGWFFVTVAGGGVMTVTPNERLIAISVDGQPTVVINRSEKGILLDVDMFNPNGALAVRIEKNQWTISATQTFKVTRPDASTLSVVGIRGEELLWVRYMNANTVKIRGAFYKIGDSQPAVITDNSINLGNMKLYMALTPQPIPFVPCFLAWTPDFRDPILTFR
jgi:hypothetical protein